MTRLRTDLGIIADWITPGSRILDLGCGDGTLLAHLRDAHNVTGYGIEIDIDNVTTCVQKGLNVIQTDLDAGLSDFDADSFDYVVMTETIQAVRHPDGILQEMLRIGREGIITFPNFGHWRCRWQLLRGRMPVTPALPAKWYNTTNIHLGTLADFEDLCRELRIQILERTVVDRTHETDFLMRLAPNLFGEIALYRFRRS